MKTESEHVQRWEDIIFEKRNKAYGAYAIRKSYEDRVLIGWAISIGVGSLIFLCSFISVEKPTIPPPTPGIPTGPMPPPVIQVDQKVQPPPPPRQVNRNLPPVATIKDVPDKPVDPIKPDEPIGSAGAGTRSEGNVQPGGPEITEPIDVPPPPKYTEAPEVWPSYEGGIQAMMKFLQKKLRYPSSAEKRKEEGTVYVSFIINRYGEVTDVEVIKGFYKDCDQEAVRVVSMLNKWKPGMQNQMPVSVKMVLPIRFRLDS